MSLWGRGCTALCCFFFFNDPATTEIYPLSLHDALPISERGRDRWSGDGPLRRHHRPRTKRDRKSTRLNSSHLGISYAVFCLEQTSELQSLRHLVCRLLLGKTRSNTQRAP